MRFRIGRPEAFSIPLPAEAPHLGVTPAQDGLQQEKDLPMKTFKSPALKGSGKASAVALVLMAGAFLAPQNASAETRTFQATFTYFKSSPAEKIYADFQHKAFLACRDDSNRPLSLRRLEKVCAVDLLDKAVTKLGRADVASLHHVQMAQIASR
jgi:hypothetical protein